MQARQRRPWRWRARQSLRPVLWSRPGPRWGPRAGSAMGCFMVMLPWLRRASERVLAGFARADADDLLEGGDEHLAVADLAGARRRLDRLDDALDDRIVDRGLDLDLGQEVDDV